MAIINLKRDYGVDPCIVRMQSTDSYATIITAGYLDTQMPAYNAINGGAFQWFPTDVILAYYQTGWAFFTISDDFSSLTPFAIAGEGTVNPGLINQVAYYASTGDAVNGLSTANDGLLVTNNSGAPSILAGPGITGKILQSNASSAPSFSTASYPSVATSTGTILRADGTNWVHSTSTFADTYAASTLLYSNGANTVTGLVTTNSAMFRTDASGVPGWTGSATDGQLLIGSAGGTPSLATLTEGSNITITNAGGSITIAATSGGSGTVNPGTANQIAYYATTGSAVSGLTSGNDGLLVTDSSGVPSILAGPEITGQILQSNTGAAPSFSTASYPSTTTANQILYSSSNNVVAQIASAAGGVLITGNTSIPSMLSNPSATGRFLQSVNGAASVWSSASFPTSVGSAGTILRSDGTNWASSTATFSNTYAASTLLYSNGANTVTGLATVDSAVLLTDESGVPSWSTTLTDGQLIIGATGTKPIAATLTEGSGISISNAGGSITITNTSPGSGTIDPGLANQLTYYAADGTELSGLPTANNGLLVTGGSGIPAIGNTIGADITINGITAGRGHGNSALNTVFGASALGASTGNNNVVVGVNAFNAAVSGSQCIIIGASACSNATAPGDYNNFIGYASAGQAGLTGIRNSSLGAFAFSNLTSGSDNCAFGFNTLFNLTTGTDNTAIGNACMQGVDASFNTAVGANCLSPGTPGTGNFNVLLGDGCMQNYTSGSENVAAGHQSLNNVTSGSQNTALGSQALDGCVDGSLNTGVGYNVGIAATGEGVDFVSGSNNTFVGTNAGGNDATINSSIAIGVQAVSTIATGITTGDAGPGISIGSVNYSVGFRGNGSIYTGGTGRGFWRPRINGLEYFVPMFIDGTITSSASMVTDTNGSPILTDSMTDGQLIIGSTSGTPIAANLTEGTGISIVNAGGSITISSTSGGGGLVWGGISGTTQLAAVNHGYVVQNASATSITLPTTFAIGDTIVIKGLGVGGWTLHAGTSTVIHVGQLATSSGGSVASANNFDVITISGLVANTSWSMDSSVTLGFTVA